MPLNTFELFLKSLKAYPVIDAAIPLDCYIPLDLSIHNTELKKVNLSASDDLEAFIWNYIKQNNAKAAFGGYLEKRGIYQRSGYFNQEDSDTERNIHLGLDIWIAANTPIFAPLNGTVHSFKNNTNHGDYGPTIILKHHIDDVEFYKLYGHLSLESIAHLSVGAEIKEGQQIATLGTAEVNGDYPPHLHFQVIKNIQNNTGDFPGVSNTLDLETFKQNCPDPNLLLKLH